MLHVIFATDVFFVFFTSKVSFALTVSCDFNGRSIYKLIFTRAIVVFI